MNTDDYICALSGLAPKEDDYVDGGDELDDLPMGWSRVTIQTRRANPKYELLLAVKSVMRDQLEAQIKEDIPDEQRNLAKASIELQVDAQFAAIAPEIPPFLIEERITYISDVKKDKELETAWTGILKELDLIEEEEESASI